MIQQKIRSASIFAFVVLAVMTVNMSLSYAASGPNGATESLVNPTGIIAKKPTHSVKRIYADDGIYVFTNGQDTMIKTPVVSVGQQRNFASLNF